ncbi:MAG: UDP-N-acetylglucosamine--N-acetylmuramyl-(pentapeptide) pyrophosphoryl-undecaprenol N-acetylglucosamine transferase [Minisyncoccia bacterium]
MIKRNSIFKIVLTGGGSGGHVFPLISVLREIKKISQEKNLSIEVIYIGPNDFTLDYFKKEGIEIKSLITGKIRRSFGLLDFLNNILDIFKVIIGIFQAFYYLFIIMPDLVLAKGGYGSFPVVFISTIFVIPIYLHESDSGPGLVNHLMAKFAKKIFISFEGAKNYFPSQKTKLVGNPIREEIFYKEEEKADKKSLRKFLGLDEKRPIITVLGGSLGAKNINDLVLDALPRLISETEIIHQTGALDFERVKREAEIVFREIIGSEINKKYYHPLPFIEESPSEKGQFNLKDVYFLSDLIVARAGSGLIFEIARSGKPAILIPLPWATEDHQRKNAYEYSRSGAAVVIEEKNLQPNIFTELIFQIIKDEKKKQEMGQKAIEFSKPLAAKEIAEELISALIKDKNL